MRHAKNITRGFVESRRGAFRHLAGAALVVAGGISLPVRAWAASSSSDAADAALAAKVPSGTKLTVADQDDAVSIPWRLSGVGNGAPYEATIANFAGGTAVLEALISGAVDIGYVGEAPLPLAVGQGVTELVAVAANANPGSAGGYFLVVQPKSGIKTVADLRGKTVAYPPGTGRHMIVASILHDNGLSLNTDVKGVQLTGAEVAPTFASGAVDAAIILGGQYFRLGKPPIIADGAGHNWGLNVWLVRKSLLKTPAKTAAVADFVRRAVSLVNWQIAHQDAWIKANYVQKQGLTFEQGKWVDEASGGGQYDPIDRTLGAVYQQISDGLFASGALKRKIDISTFIDGRFNGIVASQNEKDGVASKLLKQPKRA